MTRNNDFIQQFSTLNETIVKAISERSYGRVLELDKARQDMLKELCLMAADEVDDELLIFAEDCSRQNVRLIEQLEKEIDETVFRNSRFKKAVNAYHS